MPASHSGSAQDWKSWPFTGLPGSIPGAGVNEYKRYKNIR